MTRLSSAKVGCNSHNTCRVPYLPGGNRLTLGVQYVLKLTVIKTYSVCALTRNSENEEMGTPRMWYTFDAMPLGLLNMHAELD